MVGGCGFLGWYIVEELLQHKPTASIRVFDIRVNPLRTDPRLQLCQGACGGGVRSQRELLERRLTTMSSTAIGKATCARPRMCSGRARA